MIAVEIGVPGYVAEDRATVGWAESPEWRLSAERQSDHRHSAKWATRRHVGVTNDSQLAALHAVRIELGLRPDAIAAYFGGLRGIGSGLIIGGETQRGGGAGDFGHLNVDPSGPACSCGRNGCLQSLIGPHSLLTVGDLLPADEAARLVDERPEDAIRKIVEASDEGQAAMLQVLKRSGRPWAMRLTMLLVSSIHTPLAAIWVPERAPSIEERIATGWRSRPLPRPGRRCRTACPGSSAALFWPPAMPASTTRSPRPDHRPDRCGVTRPADLP